MYIQVLHWGPWWGMRGSPGFFVFLIFLFFGVYIFCLSFYLVYFCLSFCIIFVLLFVWGVLLFRIILVFVWCVSVYLFGIIIIIILFFSCIIILYYLVFQWCVSVCFCFVSVQWYQPWFSFQSFTSLPSMSWGGWVLKYRGLLTNLNFHVGDSNKFPYNAYQADACRYYMSVSRNACDAYFSQCHMWILRNTHVTCRYRRFLRIRH